MESLAKPHPTKTLWFMQTYLNDLSTTRRNTPSFTICQRVLLKAQNIIFSDPPSQTNTPYPSLTSSSPVTLRPRFWKRRIKPRIGPALIGMSTILAGAPGLPQVVATTGKVAVEQGRMDSGEVKAPRPFHAGADDDDFTGPSQSASTLPLQNQEEEDDLEPDSDDGEVGPEFEESDEEQDVEAFGQTTMSKLIIPPTPRSDVETFAEASPSPMSPPPMVKRSSTLGEPTTPSEDRVASSKGSALSRRATVGPSRTTPSLVRRKPIRSTVLAEAASPSHSTPSLHIARGSITSTRDSQDDPLLRLDSTVQSQLLRGHYCRSEVQFVLQLESIANRLLVVPKLAVRETSFKRGFLFAELDVSESVLCEPN